MGENSTGTELEGYKLNRRKALVAGTVGAVAVKAGIAHAEVIPTPDPMATKIAEAEATTAALKKQLKDEQSLANAQATQTALSKQIDAVLGTPTETVTPSPTKTLTTEQKNIQGTATAKAPTVTPNPTSTPQPTPTAKPGSGHSGEGGAHWQLSWEDGLKVGGIGAATAVVTGIIGGFISEVASNKGFKKGFLLGSGLGPIGKGINRLYRKIRPAAPPP